MGYVDVNIGMRYSGNVPTLYKNVLVRFLEIYEPLYNKKENKDYKELHNLKGICLHLGALKLHEAINNLEENKYDLILYNDFKGIFINTYKEIHTMISA